MNRKMAGALFVAWAIHDAEEWLVADSGAHDRAAANRGARLPMPSAAHERTAIGVMAVIVAGAAWQGARTGGRSRFYQAALAGFGLHGFGHLALTAAARGYTPGVVTAPTVVIPFAGWAWHRLGQQGIRRPAGQVTRDALPMVAGSLAFAHAGAALLRKGVARSRATSG